MYKVQFKRQENERLSEREREKFCTYTYVCGNAFVSTHKDIIAEKSIHIFICIQCVHINESLYTEKHIHIFFFFTSII